tara:strand:- start:414 stop:2057 length:1644 start_codon:yes stop_codon:yes gene_type:complete
MKESENLNPIMDIGLNEIYIETSNPKPTRNGISYPKPTKIETTNPVEATKTAKSIIREKLKSIQQGAGAQEPTEAPQYYSGTDEVSKTTNPIEATKTAKSTIQEKLKSILDISTWIEDTVEPLQDRQAMYISDGVLGGKPYKGEYQDGQATVYYAGGTHIMYEGEWENGRWHGQGIAYYSHGTVIYAGEWENGSPKGKWEGDEPYDNQWDIASGLYEGEWKNGLRHGQGRYSRYNKYPQGIPSLEYKGQWKNGLRHGTGTGYWGCARHLYWQRNTSFTSATLEYVPCPTNTRYEGEWKHGLPHGRGSFYSTIARNSLFDWSPLKDDYLMYEGEVVDGLYQGQGTEYDHIGYYKGSFQDGDRSGYGTSYTENGTVYYKGEWKDGYWHGQGAKYNNSGSLQCKGEYKYNYLVKLEWEVRPGSCVTVSQNSTPIESFLNQIESNKIEFENNYSDVRVRISAIAGTPYENDGMYYVRLYSDKLWDLFSDTNNPPSPIFDCVTSKEDASIVVAGQKIIVYGTLRSYTILPSGSHVKTGKYEIEKCLVISISN